MSITIVVILVMALGHVLSDDDMHPAVQSSIKQYDGRAKIEAPETWVISARESIAEKLNQPRIETKAKNLILMIGDGMSMSTVTAARIMKGQNNGLLGEEGRLYMETFPYVGTSKTFCSDVQISDSACSSTAYSAGYKGNFMTIGVTPAVNYQDCASSILAENQVESVLAWAQSQGMSTGIVTNTAITDASPAGSYAHAADRTWYNDQRVLTAPNGVDPDVCYDIARQLIEATPGKNINVILGGGRMHFLPNDTLDPESLAAGARGDGRNLMQEWSVNKTNWRNVTLRSDLLDVDTAKTDYLLGLFAYEHMAYEDARVAQNDPTLTEMVEVAIRILSKNPNGFYLFVEGGNIDKAHHINQAKRALVETIEFDFAVQKVDELTTDHETLIVVSADHSHVMTMAGTPPRGHPILSIGVGDSENNPATTLTYINGPGHEKPLEENGCSRTNISDDSTDHIDYVQMAMYDLSHSTHAGEDVLIFAKGPFAHLFTGINDQTFIAHAMRYAREADEALNGTEPTKNQTECPEEGTKPPVDDILNSSATHVTMSVGVCTVLVLLNYF